MRKTKSYIPIIILFSFYSCNLGNIRYNDDHISFFIPDNEWRVDVNSDEINYINHIKTYNFDVFPSYSAVVYFDNGEKLSIQINHIKETQTLLDFRKDYYSNYNIRNPYSLQFKIVPNKLINNYGGDIAISREFITDYNLNKMHQIVNIIKDGWLLEFHASIPDYSPDKEYIIAEIFRCISIEEE